MIVKKVKISYDLNCVKIGYFSYSGIDIATDVLSGKLKIRTFNEPL